MKPKELNKTFYDDFKLICVVYKIFQRCERLKLNNSVKNWYITWKHIIHTFLSIFMLWSINQHKS